MNKASELAILDRAIAELTMDSYLGPWLTAVRGEIAQDMTADFQPHMMPHEARNEAARIVAEAKERGEELKSYAQRSADMITAKARNEAADIRSSVAQALRAAETAMGCRG